MGDWIKHDGKSMPVKPEAAVDIRFDDGTVMTDFASEWHATDPRNSHWIWDADNMFGCAIVAYRRAALSKAEGRSLSSASQEGGEA